MLDQILAHSEALATLLSVMVAIAAGWSGFAVSQRRQRRQHTVSIVLSLITNLHLMSANNLLNMRIGENRPIRRDELSAEELFDVLMILSFYEFLAIAYFKKELDRSIIHEQRRSGIRDGFRVLSEFIEERRMTLRRPRLYRNFEQLARKFV